MGNLLQQLETFIVKGTRKKKKMWKIPHLGGGGPDPGNFPFSKKKKVEFKMHFLPF